MGAKLSGLTCNLLSDIYLYYPDIFYLGKQQEQNDVIWKKILLLTGTLTTTGKPSSYLITVCTHTTQNTV